MAIELYACLHVAEFPAQAMLRLRPALCGRAVAVLDGDAPFEFVCSLTPAAMRAGVHHGMPRAQLESIPQAAVLHRSPAEEIAAHSALMECAGMVSPRVEDQSNNGCCTLVADIAGTGRLLGTPAQVIDTLQRHVAGLGFTASIAVSSNFHAALCSARAGHSGVIAAGGEQAALSTLPLAVLSPSAEHLEIFNQWGIRTLGQLAELPETGLITRLGQPGRRLRQLARGVCPHLFQPIAPAVALEEFVEFDAAVEHFDSLLFAMGPMLDQLLYRARMRALAIASITVTLLLDGGKEHVRSVRPALPAQEKTLLLKLLQLDLAAHPPAAAVSAVRISAESGAGSKVQLGLFSPQLPEPSRLDVTLARIRAIVGQDRAGRAMLDDSHREQAFHLVPFAVPSTVPAQSSVSAQPRAHTAMRRLRPAEPARVSLRHAVPHTLTLRNQQYVVDRAYGPWYASGEWWSHAAWSEERWDVVARAGTSDALLCCCLLRDLARSTWHVEALYD